MSTRWSEIYEQCCQVILENGGLQLGLLTNDQFYAMAGEVMTDFLNKTGIIKKLFNVPMHFAISEYEEPEQMGDLDVSFAAQTYLFQTSGYYLDNYDDQWKLAMNYPESFREDELPPKSIQLFPSPNVEGNQVATLGGTPGFGALAATSHPVDFDEVIAITSPQGGYGTPNAFGGAPYVEVTTPGYGVRSVKNPSTGNVLMIGTALPFNTTGITGETYVELVPDSFTLYLKYGILQKIFSSDSELKDTQKAFYCQARYSEGINLAGAIMANEYMDQ